MIEKGTSKEEVNYIIQSNLKELTNMNNRGKKQDYEYLEVELLEDLVQQNLFNLFMIAEIEFIKKEKSTIHWYIFNYKTKIKEVSDEGHKYIFDLPIETKIENKYFVIEE